MKKDRILLFFLILAALAMGFSSHHSRLATRKDIAKMLRNEIQAEAADKVSVSFLGEYEKDRNAVLWYEFHNQETKLYRVEECYKIREDGYALTATYKPMIYAPGIMHVVIGGEDIFLITTSLCQSIIYKDKNGKTIKEMDISMEEKPYIFVMESFAKEVSCSFEDADGNDIE